MQRLPMKFVQKFGHELSNVALLKVNDGKNWSFDLRKANNEIVFHNNWLEFVEYYSISLGHLLVFKYDGNSSFDVAIFDMTCSEITYPEEVNNDEEPSGTEERTDEFLNDATQVALQNNLKPKHPYFRVVMAPSYVRAGGYSRVPYPFARQYLKNNIKSLRFEVSDNGKCQEWEVGYVKYNDRYIRLSKGWGTFVKGNNLKEGDTCVFEMIKQNASFKVHIFRSGEIVPEFWDMEDGCNLSAISKENRELKLKYPSFTLVMKSTKVARLSIIFAREHLKNGTNNVTLRVTDGRTYQVICLVYRSYALFSGGWRMFTLDNNLKKEDKCLFELIEKEQQIVFEVHILAEKGD
ncbi:hypothetical protein ACHQM5_016371 [Ranunculus cassubicifolius]